MSNWYQDAVIYELHVRAYCDSNGDGIGDFDGLRSKLDHLADLGVTAIWLLPFYPSPLRDDGYDIADYRRVHPDYGTLAAFRRFLKAAHDRDLKVITELVINHTSDQHPWFQRARKAAPGSPERDFYVWSDTTQKYEDARIIFSDFETSNWSWDPVAESYYWHRFYSHQPDLNFENPAVQQAVFDVMDYWLEMGVDGLRLDAVPYLYEREGTNCENLEETHVFLKKLRAHIDANHDGKMLLAEANQWPEDAASYFGDGDECHMNFQFPAMPRLFMGLRQENRSPIVDIMEQTPPPPEGGQWATFLRNHDELTLEMVTDEERDYMVRAYANDPQMRINLGIRRRLAPLLDNDRRKIELLNSLLFSLPGAPVLYYGDEIGMGDNVYLGDRDGVRTPMQWSPDRNAGFSSANPHRLYLPLVTEPGYHFENVNVEAQDANPSSLLSWMRQLITLRSKNPVLATGDISFLDPENHHVLAFFRTLEGERPFMVVANLSRLAQPVELDLRSHMGSTPVEVFGQTRFAPIGELPYYLTLAPYGFYWFALEAPADVDALDDTPRPLLSGRWPQLVSPGNKPFASAVAAWLPHQRWFSAKGAEMLELKVKDSILIPHPDLELAFVILAASFSEGDDQLYSLPVCRLDQGSAVPFERLRPSAIIARCADGSILIDAMLHEPAVAGVVGAALGKKQHRGSRGKLVGQSRRRGMETLTDDAFGIHLLGVEQSNTSAIIGGEIIAKLVRRLEPGEHPDVELPLFLRSQGFMNVPALAASLEYEGDNGVENMAVMVVHEAITNDADLWEWTHDELSRLLEHPDLAAPSKSSEAASSLEIVDLVGKRLAELHDTLCADGPFTPEPFTLLHQRSILQNLRTQWKETRRLLIRWRKNDTSFAADDPALKSVDAMLAMGTELLEPLDRLRTEKLEALRIRPHGDLHLGQILWTGRDAVFIDFEGEPSRSLGERKLKRTPLIDVAGMIRSIDYVSRAAVDTTLARGAIASHAQEATIAWAADWTAQATHRLVTSYLENLTTEGLVPNDPEAFDLLLSATTVAKALYEIQYEMANRPSWVPRPVAAIVNRLALP